MSRPRTAREPLRGSSSAVGRWRPGWRTSTMFAFAFVLVGSMFFTSLRGGGSLVSADMVEVAAPFNEDLPFDFQPQIGPGDPINIHAHWTLVSDLARSGNFSWWTTSLGGGYPTLKGGLPIFDAAYLVVPAWYAPGLVAALRTLAAMLLMVGFLRSLGVDRAAAVLGGSAFAFSGFMVGWMNWPHSTVAALIPGLLWAIERVIASPRIWRAAPLGMTVAAMVWANFPQVTIFALLGASVYAVIRLVVEVRIRSDTEVSALSMVGRRALVVGLAAVLAVGMMFPHLVSFGEYVRWAETSQRNFSADTAAGGKFLLTSIAPAIFGSDPIGPRWWAFGNWVEFQTFAGASVVLLAGFAFVRREGDDSLLGSRRRAAAWAMLVIGALGAILGYLGGPIGDLAYDVVGSRFGLATRAKVLLSLAFAVGAAFGADAWFRAHDSSRKDDLRRGSRRFLVVVLVIGLAFVPSIRELYRDIEARSIARETALASVWPAASALVVAVLLWLRFRDRLGGELFRWLLVATVAIELLQFSVQVPTVVGRSDRLEATEAHQQVRGLLGPGERLAGEGNSFFANTGQLFGIDDARGQVLKSPGYQALMRQVDDRMFTTEFGGTPTHPGIPAGTDPTSPVWDALAVGVWSQFPSTPPPGPVIEARPAIRFVDPIEQVLFGEFTVPEHGLRAIELELDAVVWSPGRLRVEVEVDDRILSTTRRRDDLLDGMAVFTLTGDDLSGGSMASVTVTADGPVGNLLVGLDDTGSLALTVIGGAADGLRVARSGDVTLINRDSPGFVRLFDAAVQESDVAVGAVVVANRVLPGPALVDTVLGLPEAADPDARMRVESVFVRGGTSKAVIDVDRSAVVVFSNNAYPGWQAEVDGVATPVFTVDTAFTGVLVEPGRHEVVLTFHPRHLMATSSVAVLSLVVSFGLLASALVERRRRHHEAAAEGR